MPKELTSSGCCRRYCHTPRQIDRERRAFAQFAFHRDGAPGLVRKAVNLRQAETGPLADRLGGEKRIEHLGHDVRGNADPGIPDGDGHMIALSSAVIEDNIAGLDGHRTAVRHGIARIDGQVDQRRFEFGGVNRDRP